MTAWLAAALTGPVFLLGTVFPGWGNLSDGGPVPAPVRHAVTHADLATESPGQAMFNNPYGGRRSRYALVRHINATIRKAPRGATVRVAVYSFAMPSTARTLVRAHARGVAVQVVVDGHSARWRSVRLLRHRLGGDTRAPSFVRVCHRSCRGSSGNQHAKFVTLSKSGRADQMVMVGSMNLTPYAAARQWQDLYTVAEDPRLYAQFVHVFSLMAQDRPQRRLTLPLAGEGFRTEVAPLPRYSPGNDPVLRRLRRVHCHGATHGTGRHGRTVVRISMHAWNGERGLALARRVARLGRSGCDVRVLAGVGFGPQVTRALRAGGVGYRDSRRHGRATHEKLMFLSGHYGSSRDASFVWTGSHNWSDRSLRNDEVTLRVAGPRLVAEYRRNFHRIWRVAGRHRKPG